MATRIYHEACFTSAQQSVGGPQGAPKKRPAGWPTMCAFCHAPITKGSPIAYVKGDTAPGTEPAAPESAPVIHHHVLEELGRNAPAAPIPAIPGDLGALLGALLSLPGRVQTLECNQGKVDVDALVARVLEQVEKPVTISVQGPIPFAPVDMGHQHNLFATLLKMAASRVNTLLVGPSASGKTTAVHNVAKALSLPYYYTGAVTDPYPLIGFMNAQGAYVRTLFREAYEHGGVFLWDEIDGSDPNALVAFNACLANGHAAFPDRMVARHPDLIVFGAANTWGTGATREYVGRNQLDTASLKRFVPLEWPYDEALERATAPNPEWTARVQKCRAKVQAAGIRHMVTPRESYQGAQLLAAGLTVEECERMLLRGQLTDDQWAKVRP